MSGEALTDRARAALTSALKTIKGLKEEEKRLKEENTGYKAELEETVSRLKLVFNELKETKEELKQTKKSLAANERASAEKTLLCEALQNEIIKLKGGKASFEETNVLPAVGGNKRKINSACRQCLKIHSKCDGLNPCARCIKRGLSDECVYDSDGRKVSRVRRTGNGGPEDNVSTNSEAGNGCDKGTSGTEGGASSDMTAKGEPPTDPALLSDVKS